MTTGSALAQFTITLSQAASEQVAVEWYTSDGTALAGVDYAANKGTVHFAAGETAKTVDILVYGRAVGSEDRSFFVEMLPPANAILGASIGECIIHVDTTGSTPVTQIIVPTGPQGVPGEPGPEGPQGPKGDTPTAADIADLEFNAKGTADLAHPDVTTIAETARRGAYVAEAKIATVVLADGDNLIAQSDLTGDTIDISSVGLYPRIIRGALVISPQWNVQTDGRLLIKSAVAGDVLYVCQYDVLSGQSVTRLSREAIRRSYAEAGYSLVAGSFGTGGAVTSATSALLFEADGKAYRWGGALPKNVPTGSTPASSGGFGPAAWSDISGLLGRELLAGKITAVGGSLAPTPDWSSVPSHTDPDYGAPLNEQAQALLNRTTKLGLNELTPDLYGSQAVATAISRRQRRTDNHIWFLGDSHSWGEGAPEYINYANLTGYSLHSAMLGSRGFVAQAIEKICGVRGWDFGSYLSVNNYIGGKALSGNYSRTPADVDPEKTRSMNLISGRFTSAEANLATIRNRSCDKFYRPVAFGDTYSITEYKEKLSVGRFSKSIMAIQHETATAFYPDTKEHYFSLPVNITWAAGTAGFTDVLGDGGVVVATRSNASGLTHLISLPNVELPYWMTVGSLVVLPGYGLVKIYQQLANGAIEIRDSTDAVPAATILKYIHQGIRLYPAIYLQKALASVDFDANHSRAYIAVHTGPTRGKMRIYTTDGITIGGRSDPYMTAALLTKKLNTYAPSNQFPQMFLVYSMKQDGSLEPNDTSVTIGSDYIEIECNTVSIEEVIYVVDFGGKAAGRLFIESVESNRSIGLRGVVFDNNYAVNLAMGGHTVGAWLGEEASFSSETRDHIGDFLNYTPVRPMGVVVQVPFVNEYLKQTPIATFKTRLQTLVTRINGHMPAGQNQLGTAFIFFTTLRNREIAFAGAAQSPITYDMYVTAAKEVCVAGGHEFVDIEKKLLSLPGELGLPYERLYLNSNHPSDLTNMVIADELALHVMSLG